LVLSPAWDVWYQALLAERLAACPRERAVTYYFSQSGDDASGDGSEANPWRSLARAQQVLDATAPGGDVALLFRRGDIWREPVGIQTTLPRVTIADYGTGEKPLFTAFEVLPNPAGWIPVPGTVNTYRRAQALPVSWCKEDDDLDNPYTRCSSVSSVEAVEGSFWWDEEHQALYIHPKHGPSGIATDPRVDGKVYERVRPRGSGVLVAGHGSRIQNIRAQGWGMQLGPTNQEHGIESRAGGTDQVVIIGCESHYGMTHCMTHYSNNGGIATFVGCSAGLTTFAAGGGETMFNTYAYYGANQTIWDHCTATHGTLPSDTRDNSRRQGMGFYGHTSGLLGANMGLTITYGCVVRDALRGCKTASAFSNLIPAPRLEDVRCFLVGELFEGGATTGDGFQIGLENAARVNGRYLNLRPPYLGAACLAAWPARGWAVNCTVDTDLSDQPGDFGLFRTTMYGRNTVQIWNCDLRFRTRAGQQARLDYQVPAQAGGATVYNSILCNTGPGDFYPNLPLPPAHAGRGGPPSALVGNAYYHVDPGASARDPYAVVLAAAPPLGGRPSCYSPVSCGSAALSAGYSLGYDQTGAVRFRNDIGPVESYPCGNCDESTAPPVLNIADFVCFTSKFAAGDPAANCDGSTSPPVLDVLDMICFQARFAAGCR
jgi:hypothetical protein